MTRRAAFVLLVDRSRIDKRNCCKQGSLAWEGAPFEGGTYSRSEYPSILQITSVTLRSEFPRHVTEASRRWRAPSATLLRCTEFNHTSTKDIFRERCRMEQDLYNADAFSSPKFSAARHAIRRLRAKLCDPKR